MIEQREAGGHVDLISGAIAFRSLVGELATVEAGRRHHWRTPVIEPDDPLPADDVSELALGLVEHEVTVVGDASLASARLCAFGPRLDAGVFVIEVERSCASVRGEPEAAADVGAAVQCWRAEPEPEPETDPQREPEPEREPEPQREPEPRRALEPAPRRWGATIGAAGGVELRLPGFAPTLLLDLAAVHPSGAFVGAIGRLAPSRAEQLVIVDGALLASAGWRGRVGERLVIQPGAGVGLDVHRFAFPDEPTRHRFDVAVRVAIELDVRVARRTYVSVAVGAMIGSRRLVHRVIGDEVWRRNQLRLDALVGLRFDPLAQLPK